MTGQVVERVFAEDHHVTVAQTKTQGFVEGIAKARKTLKGKIGIIDDPNSRQEKTEVSRPRPRQ